MMNNAMKPVVIAASVALFGCATHTATAQNNDKAATAGLAGGGSSAFCLFEVSSKDGTTRWVNLGIVQFVELNRERVRLTYGGGNFGSGYDNDLPVKSREEGIELIRRIQQTARECARHMGPGMGGMGGMGGMRKPDAPAPEAPPANGGNNGNAK